MFCEISVFFFKQKTKLHFLFSFIAIISYLCSLIFKTQNDELSLQ
jgi:uncharacterized protein (DUF486 family)